MEGDGDEELAVDALLDMGSGDVADVGFEGQDGVHVTNITKVTKVI